MPPPPIRTDSTNAFAHHTMRVRAPAIIRETMRLNPELSDETQDSLQALAHDLESDAVIGMIQHPSEDYMGWQAAYLAHDGDTWGNTDWFYAETFMYRHLVERCGWFTTKRDPFSPKKRQEMAGMGLWTALERALSIAYDPELAPGAKLSALLYADLWANRIDLSYARSAAQGAWDVNADDVLIDDTNAVVDTLMQTSADSIGAMHIILDNAGTELALDLALADFLLDGHAETVTLHVKQHPTFVSDAIRADVLDFLSALRERGHSMERVMGDRLSGALSEGRLELQPDWFWNSSRFLPDHPDLAGAFGGAALVVIKGDANYRRMVGDALWESTRTLREVIPTFPAPLLALRTLKSDPLVGLASGVADRLDAVDSEWRVNGKRGVIQFKP